MGSELGFIIRVILTAVVCVFSIFTAFWGGLICLAALYPIWDS